MQLVCSIADRAALDPDATLRAVRLIAAHLVDHAPKKPVGVLRQHVPELDELAVSGREMRARPQEEPRGLLGRLGALTSGAALTAAAGALIGGAEGGGAAKLMTLVGELGREGLDLADLRRLASAMIAVMRERAGDAVVDDQIAGMTGRMPFLARFVA